MKKIANCIHHTHWDPLWYFTAQDAMVQFTYNMKEMLAAFDDGKIENFFLDGQTAALDEYLELHPEDREKISKLVKEKKLFVGPFNSQLDCFISSGEAVINNLRLGIKTGDALGGVSKIAYLPDSFGHSYDFPKIFNQMGIYDFVITRGVGDEYNLGSEFYLRSNDGSKVLVCTMISGYGYGAYPFKYGTLLTDKAEDYNRIDVKSLIERLVTLSSVENEFVFPLGFDQNPIMLNIEEKIKKYNSESNELYFQLTTWEEFMQKVRERGQNLKVHDYELFSTQYHRIHKSIFSARADIKALQDEAERILAFEVQPLMAMLDQLGVPYDQSILDKAWDTLVRCQTHASATLTDETNEYIKVTSNNALNIAKAAKVYLMKITALSVENQEPGTPLVVFNTLPYKRDLSLKLNIYTKKPEFKLFLDGRELPYTVVSAEEQYGGVLRKSPDLMTEDRDFWKTTVILNLKDFPGIAYKTIQVMEAENSSAPERISKTGNYTENARFKVELLDTGLRITDKLLNRVFNQALYLEESGDAGDNYDYSYPDEGEDLIITHYFKDAKSSAWNAAGMSEMTLQGSFKVPENLEERKAKKCNSDLSYKIRLRLRDDSDVIELNGSFANKALNHRVRLVISSEFENHHSYAGTQFGYIKRETSPEALKFWREENWFEEPSPTNPLLNHVSAVGDAYTVSAFTRSIKEYEFIGAACKDIALTIFRSVGHLGLPDLNRRPGRPSGLDYKVIETPDSQLLGEITFEVGLTYYDDFDGNNVMNDYVRYATNQMYYQNQTHERTVFKLSYFPTNPLPFALPKSYDFIGLENSRSAFSTVVKSEDNDGYVLRIYNNENHAIEGGRLTVGFDYNEILKTNILETEKETATLDVGKLDPGELRNIKISK
ncbi:MAG: PTS fructose transporter subunit IIA [Firmicutes bacterium]|nr:PTS fructose transporter subunit IIA [Bacillota bacterium]